jgi:hypothetical protein
MTYPPPYEQQPGAQPTQPVPPGSSSSPPTTPYPTYLGSPTPPPRRSNGPILAVVIALAVLLVGGAGVAAVLLANRSDEPSALTSPSPTPEAPETAETTPAPDSSDDGSGSGDYGSGAKVVYEVTGEGAASIVYFKGDGITPVRVGDTDLPWRQELRLENDAALVSVNATRASGKGTLECRITIDGEEVAKKSAKGNFATVLCSKLIL